MSKTSRIVVLTIFLILGVIAIQLPAYADGAAGVIMGFYCLAGILCFFLVFTIEAVLIQRMLALGTLKSLVSSFVLNIFSAAGGFATVCIHTALIKSNWVLFLILFTIVVIPAMIHGVVNRTVKLMVTSIITATIGGLILIWLMNISEGKLNFDEKIGYKIILYLSILLYQYGMTLAYEAIPARRYFPAGEIDRAVLYINTVSYLILIGTTAILLALLRFLAFLHDVL